jgi:hypothetical protein
MLPAREIAFLFEMLFICPMGLMITDFPHVPAKLRPLLNRPLVSPDLNRLPGLSRFGSQPNTRNWSIDDDFQIGSLQETFSRKADPKFIYM